MAGTWGARRKREAKMELAMLVDLGSSEVEVQVSGTVSTMV